MKMKHSVSFYDRRPPSGRRPSTSNLRHESAARGALNLVKSSSR